MAFTSDERTAITVHLRFLRALAPNSWIEASVLETVLDDATDAQQAQVRADLPTLERLRLGLSKVDARFSLLEVVGELKFRDNEFALRVEQYAAFLLQLGLLLGVARAGGGGAVVRTSTKRGW